jgi:hypothetical protein
MDARAREELRARGEAPGALHNNCSASTSASWRWPRSSARRPRPTWSRTAPDRCACGARSPSSRTCPSASSCPASTAAARRPNACRCARWPRPWRA